MIKVGRDFVLLFIMSFLYILFNKAINISMAESIIVSVGTAGMLTLLSDTVRNIDEDDIRTKFELSDEEVKVISKMRLVVRDGILTFVLCYVIMTICLGGAELTILSSIPFVIAALAPTLVVFKVSKELRIPSKRNVIVDR